MSEVPLYSTMPKEMMVALKLEGPILEDHSPENLPPKQ